MKSRHMHRSAHVMSGRVGGTGVLFDLKDRQLHSLNDTAVACWELLNSASSIEHLVELVATAYGQEQSEVSDEVTALVEYFESTGLCGVPADPPQRSTSANRNVITVARSRTPWTVGPFSALTIPMVLEVRDDEMLRADLQRIVAPLLSAQSPADDSVLEAIVDIKVQRELDRWFVAVGGQMPQGFGSRSAVIRHVVATINSKPLEYLDDLVVLHAGAIEFGDGITVFPGISNAGKSTLVTQLVHRGYGYITDEATAVRPHDHEVVPFPKSISIDVGGQRVLNRLTGIALSEHAVDVDPRRVGPGNISSGGQVKRIVFPEYTPSQPTVLERLDAFDSFSRLLANTFCFDRAGQTAFDTLVSLANEVPAYSLQHSGDAVHLSMLEELAVPRNVRRRRKLRATSAGGESGLRE